MGKKLITDVKAILNRPFDEWTNAQLKFEVASQLNDPSYIIMLDHEKEDRKYPVSRDEMINYIRQAWSK